MKNKHSGSRIFYRSYNEARDWVQKTGIKTPRQWEDAVKQNKIPIDIPKQPGHLYKRITICSCTKPYLTILNKKLVCINCSLDKEGWTYGGKRMPGKNNFVSFKKAKAFVKKLNLKTNREFRKLLKEKKIPREIPACPDHYYKEWNGWSDFIGTNKIQHYKTANWKSYKESKEFVQKLKFKSVQAYKKWARSGKKPIDIPNNANIVYKKEWKGWNEFLGLGKTPNAMRVDDFVSFEVAKQWAKKLNIISKRQWKKACQKGLIPANVPRNPERIYDKEWYKKRGKK